MTLITGVNVTVGLCSGVGVFWPLRVGVDVKVRVGVAGVALGMGVYVFVNVGEGEDVGGGNRATCSKEQARVRNMSIDTENIFFIFSL